MLHSQPHGLHTVQDYLVLFSLIAAFLGIATWHVIHSLRIMKGKSS